MTNLKDPQTPGNADQGASGPTAHVGGGDGPQPVAPPTLLHIQLDRRTLTLTRQISMTVRSQVGKSASWPHPQSLRTVISLRSCRAAQIGRSGMRTP